MKSFPLAALLLLGLPAASYAQQLPNAGFESWTTTAGHARPTHWLTTDDLLAASWGAPAPVPSGTVTAAPDSYSGHGAVRLATVGRLPGYLVLGNDNPAGPHGQLSGMPYTGRPAAMQLRYRLRGGDPAADQPTASIALTRLVNGRQQVLATGSLALPAAATYSLATIPLQYESTLTPDSVVIIITSGTSSKPNAAATLDVDDVTLTEPQPAPDLLATTSLVAYPNPSPTGRFTLYAAQEPALLNAPLTVSDLAGRVVLTQPAPASGTNCRELDLQGQPAGLYLLRLATPAGTVTRRLHLR